VKWLNTLGLVIKKIEVIILIMTIEDSIIFELPLKAKRIIETLIKNKPKRTAFD
jgi:hypothetical protein